MNDTDRRICPICHTDNAVDADSCHRCGWGLTAYLGKPTAEETAQLREALRAARVRWWRAHPALALQLGREAGEDEAAFQRFVAGLPPLPAGQARLVGERGANHGASPGIEIDLPDWLAGLAGLPERPAIDCDAETARRLGTDAVPVPIVAQIGVQGKGVRVTRLELLFDGGAYPIIEAPRRRPAKAKPSPTTKPPAVSTPRVRDGIGIGIAAVLSLAYAIAGAAIAMGHERDGEWMIVCGVAAATAILVRLILSRRVIVHRPWAADISGMMLDEISATGWGRLVGIAAAIPIAIGYGLAYTDPASLPGGARLGALTGLSAGFLAGTVVATCGRSPIWLNITALAVSGALFGCAIGSATGAIIGTIAWTLAELTGLIEPVAITALVAISIPTGLMAGGWWARLCTRDILAMLRP